MIVLGRYVPHSKLAEHTGDSPQAIYKHRQAGRLHGFKVGKDWHSDIDVVNAWISEWRPEAGFIRSKAKERMRVLEERTIELQDIVQGIEALPDGSAKLDLLHRTRALLEDVMRDTRELRRELADDELQRELLESSSAA